MIIVPNPAPMLILDGDLDLNGPGTDPTGIAFAIETGGPSATGPGIDWGNPEAITREITSQLADGTLVTQDGVTNRSIVLPLRVKADTSVGLAAGEAALMHRSGDYRTTLAWTPPVLPEDPAVTSVFEIWVSTLAGQTDTLGEQRYTRYFTLTLTAKPYTRSVDQVLVSALDGEPTSSDDYVFTSVDDCTSTTGWTSSPGSPALGGTSPDESVSVSITTIASSRIYSGPFSGSPRYLPSLTRTFGSPVDMSDTPYLVVKVGMPGVSWTPKVRVDGVLLDLVAQEGRSRTYRMPDGVTGFTVLQVVGEFFTKRRMTVPLRVYDVSRSNGAGTLATGREQARTLWVDGSARTYGSLSVQHETDGLGDVIVYTVPTSPAGYVPAMQRYQTDGPTPVADTDAVTGVKQLITVDDDSDVPVVFTIPAGQLIEGTYGVAARIKSDDHGDYTVNVVASVDNHPISGESAILQASATLADSEYQIVWLGTLFLPPLALPAESDQNIFVVIDAETKGWTLISGDPSGQVYLDELWLFNLTDGAVTIVHAGDQQRLWLDSADEDRLNPTVFLGNDADRSDATGASLSTTVAALGRHQLLPGLMDVFTVTTEAADAVAATAYYKRWLTNAAS